ncbi:MAG: hypothetical protein J6P36_04085 [Lachnospiraceae bacterium]|nr:hypothetical protein [Lachnospiraceae bacterium]
MASKEKKDNPVFVAFICILLCGPWVAGPILLGTHHTLAGILAIVIPYSGLALWGVLRKRKQKKDFYKIKDADARFDIVPVSDTETIKALYDNSALTFFVEETDPKLLNWLYNWLNNEGVLKSERLNLYTYTGQDLKNAFGKRKRFRTEDKLMSIFLKDLDINDSNELQFSTDRLQIGGRWLDDIVGNS